MRNDRGFVMRAMTQFKTAWKRGRFPTPDVGLVLGSGLAPLAERIRGAKWFNPSGIRAFPKPTVPGHSAKLVVGTLGGVRVAAFVGRIHAYEGAPLPLVALPARFLCAAGARMLVLTNAAGSLHEDWAPGQVMLITDHLNLLGGSPLEGMLDKDFGSRFVDMGTCWPADLRARARALRPRRLVVREGVYAAVRGPQYETAAEVRMLRALGADAVGMSTVPEAIAAAQMRVPALGISLLTNHATGVAKAPLSHADVLEAGRRAAGPLADWIERIVAARHT